MDSDLEDVVTNKIWSSQKCCLSPRPVPHLKLPFHGKPDRLFKIGPVLGYGGYGKVYAASDHSDNGKTYALKIVDKVTASKASLRVVVREISLLRVLQHPNVVELLEVYESPSTVCLVLEKCDESLHALLVRRNRPFNELEMSYVVNQIGEALDYIHMNEISHRDIKLVNILCKRSTKSAPESKISRISKNRKPKPVQDLRATIGAIKLSDFGLGACRGAPGTSNMFSCTCGTAKYMAPEVLSKKPYTQACDIWSLGVVVFYCLIGIPPFPGKTQEDVLFQIQMSNVTLKGKVWDTFSNGIKALIKGMLTVDPEQRIMAREILSKPWTKQTVKNRL